MEMNLKETGKRIQLLRKQKGLSQEELADKFNVSSNTVAKIECGMRRPATKSGNGLQKTLQTIAIVPSLSVRYLRGIWIRLLLCK